MARSVKQASMSTFARVLWRRRWFFSSVLFSIVAISILSYFLSPTRYTAFCTVNFQKSGADSSGISDLISGSAGGASDVLSANVDLQTQSKILQSDVLAVTVIQDLSLEDKPEFQSHFSLKQRLSSLFKKPLPEEPKSVPLAQTVRRRDRVVSDFEKNLNVRILAGTRLIEVDYTDASPQTAAKIVNDLVRSLNDYTFQTKFKASTEVTTWLESQLGDLRRASEDLQQRLVAAQKTSGLFGVGGSDSQGRSTVYSPALDRLQQSTTELAQVEANRVLKGAIYGVVKSGDAELISQLSGTSVNTGNGTGVTSTFTTLQGLRSEETTLQVQIAKDASTFGPAYPRLIEERSSLRRTQDLIQAEIERIRERAKNDYEIATRAEASARLVYEENRAAAEEVNDRTIEYSLLKREADSSQSLYQDLLKRLKEAGIIESLKSSNLTIVDPAHPPAYPSKPVLRLHLGLGLFGGLIFAAAATQMRERISNTILAQEDIEAAGEHVFGIVPILRPQTGTARLAHGVRPTLDIQMLSAPRSAFSEAIRHLRSSLMISRSSTPPQVILVTSGSPSEGKSTLSVELAVCFAQMNTPVLLIEGDLRRPVMRQRLNVSGAKGLSNLLTDSKAEAELMSIPGVPQLSILLAGPVPPFSAELLASQRMKDLLAIWRQQFTFVIIDCPPVLAVTDMLMLADQADAILLVARSEQTGQAAFVNSRRMLEPFLEGPDKKVFGAVINAVSTETLKYYGYYGNNYEKYYNETDDV
jgi:succinoglycan biosynthesis transport protein ExoP